MRRPGQDQYRYGIKSAIAMLKLEAGCADCGYDKDPDALDFDHVTPGKTKRLARLVGEAYSLERCLAEIDLCEVVCANCHRIRTRNRYP